MEAINRLRLWLNQQIRQIHTIHQLNHATALSRRDGVAEGANKAHVVGWAHSACPSREHCRCATPAPCPKPNQRRPSSARALSH